MTTAGQEANGVLHLYPKAFGWRGWPIHPNSQIEGP